MNPLGRKTPPNFDHVSKYPFGALGNPTVTTVNKVLKLPTWHWTHDQGQEGSCVGHGSAMERAICNTGQNIVSHLINPGRRYDPIDIWNQAKLHDGDPSTNPGDDNGTYVHTAYDILRNEGPRRVKSMHLIDGVPIPVGELSRSLSEGVSTTRWAKSVDDVRTALSLGSPVTIGINWYDDFDTPALFGREYWIAKGGISGSIRGGHCVCIYGASDKLDAVRIKNSWGHGYPLVWLPYEALARLITEEGEVALTTDR